MLQAEWLPYGRLMAEHKAQRECPRQLQPLLHCLKFDMAGPVRAIYDHWVPYMSSLHDWNLIGALITSPESPILVLAI